MTTQIPEGTRVRTTTDNELLRRNDRQYQERGREKRKPGLEGVVCDYSDAHGLSYHVQHEDGSLGWYEPEELVIVDPAHTPLKPIVVKRNTLHDDDPLGLGTPMMTGILAKTTLSMCEVFVDEKNYDKAIEEAQRFIELIRWLKEHPEEE